MPQDVVETRIKFDNKQTEKSMKEKTIVDHEPRVGQNGKKVYKASGQLWEDGFRCLPYTWFRVLHVETYILV